jgi:TonB family protein
VTDPSAAAGASPFSGPSIVGVGSRPADIRFRAYYNQIIARVTAAWILPDGIAAADSKLVTVIGLRISTSGVIEKQWILRGSGNIYYDQTAIRAIKKASPLPPLPVEMREETHDVGIRF